MIRMFKYWLFGLLPVLLVIFSGWNAFSSGQSGVWQTIKQATVTFDDEKSVDAIPEPQGKRVLVEIKYQGGRFWTETRTDKIERFQCSQCHNDKKVAIPQAVEIAHGDIVLDHGGQERPLSCFTCHDEEDRNVLEIERGVKVDLDHSYQLCGQCHFRQKSDWVGGAHGKRVSNWAGDRVVKNCTSCHNPHSPKFERRWPKTYSPPYD